MKLSTDPYKGTRDFYPEEMRFRKWMFGKMAESVESYGYEPYDGPMLEPFDLYAAKTGEEIVNKQLFWLIDQGERKLAVRPEMTPTMARMVAARVHELAKPVRWYSIPNLWRYERPQRGRLREHWQLNVDLLGGDALLADVEILQVALSIMNSFCGDSAGNNQFEIRVNHRELMDVFFKTALQLNAEQGHKIIKAIDMKDKVTPEVFLKMVTDAGLAADKVPALNEFFTLNIETVATRFPCAGADHLKKVFAAISTLAKVNGGESSLKFDATILRGMDYYTGMVFEIYDKHPDNRRAMFGGGRYDNLIGLFGKDQLSGVGFGMGDASLENFLDVHGLKPKIALDVDVFVSTPAEQFVSQALEYARELRAAGAKVTLPLSLSAFGAQLKMASKSNAKFSILFGDTEWAKGEILIKDMTNGTQIAMPKNEVAKWWAGVKTEIKAGVKK